MSPCQIIGNACAALAVVVFLWPLQKLLWAYAEKNLSNNEWVTPILFALIPLWLLLMAALLCVAASGGFDWLRLGRPFVYALTASAAVGLAAASFVAIAMYIRPGFIPRVIFTPGIYLVPLGTVLLVVLSLNPGLAPGGPPSWLRWPWAIFAALSLIACVGFLGHRLVTAGVGGIAGLVHRLGNPGPSEQETLAKIATLDPEQNFESLLWQASGSHRAVREAATARLRSHPRFLESLAAGLEHGHVEPAVSFLHSATLTDTEKSHLARPAQKAMQRWVSRIPAPNYTTKDNLKRLRRWGAEMFPALVQKFAGTGVDFAEVIADFEERVGLTK